MRFVIKNDFSNLSDFDLAFQILALSCGQWTSQECIDFYKFLKTLHVEDPEKEVH